MEDKLKKLAEPLKIENVDFRVQSVNNGGYVTILAYKDARVDMQRLDDVIGPMNWKREHLRDNANCIVSIYDNEKKMWIGKEDTGTESFAEAAKGLASDSFKRACFNWGIGRELYDYPMIKFKLGPDEISERNGKKGTAFGFMDNLRWLSQFDDSGKLTFLACKDKSDKLRFTFGEFIKEKE